MVSSHLDLDCLVTSLPGIGAAYQKKLAQLNITTIRDLLHHYPTRFLDYTKPCFVKDLREKQNWSLKLTLDQPKQYRHHSKKLVTEVHGHDVTGEVSLIWFNTPYISRLIQSGQTYLVAGKTSTWGGHRLVIITPTIELANQPSLHTHGLVPIYPLTSGLTSRFLRTKIKQALQLTNLVEPLTSPPPDLLSYPQALNRIHHPVDLNQHLAADRRLAFNYHLAANIHNQLTLQTLPPAIALTIDPATYRHCQTTLPFELTKSQKQTIRDSYCDLSKPHFTHRLIQGETGSGKTVIAFFLAVATLAAQKSLCLLAPTQILAQQHFHTFLKFGLTPRDLLLVTSLKPIKSLPQKPTIFIGTHALINQIGSNLKHPLCCLIVDEQHRFGVKQREELLRRDPIPHLFNLTATPIPRTLALGLFGDIQISTIKKRRRHLPVKTWLVTSKRFRQSTSWLEQQIASGSKVFAVAPTINTSQTKDIASANQLYQQYQRDFCHLCPVFLIHGQMDHISINKNLQAFAKAPHSLLVSTSMIEVGVDIPNADIIIIHSASNFGLASLHQLRGRVGRSGNQGYCLLVDDDPLASQRLQLLSRYNSGLILAKKDLYLRGAGELSGFKQHGRLPIRLKHFWDKSVYHQAKAFAQQLTQTNPALAATIAINLISC